MLELLTAERKRVSNNYHELKKKMSAFRNKEMSKLK
jgi:hypothetical protein